MACKTLLSMSPCIHSDLISNHLPNSLPHSSHAGDLLTPSLAGSAGSASEICTGCSFCLSRLLPMSTQQTPSHLSALSSTGTFSVRSHLPDLFKTSTIFYPFNSSDNFVKAAITLQYRTLFMYVYVCLLLSVSSHQNLSFKKGNTFLCSVHGCIPGTQEVLNQHLLNECIYFAYQTIT